MKELWWDIFEILVSLLYISVACHVREMKKNISEALENVWLSSNALY